MLYLSLSLRCFLGSAESPLGPKGIIGHPGRARPDPQRGYYVLIYSCTSTHICMYVCIYIYIYIYIYVHIKYMYQYQHQRQHQYIHISMYMPMCMYVCMYVCIHIYIYIYIWDILAISLFPSLSHIYIYIYIYTCYNMYRIHNIYIYVYIYIHIKLLGFLSNASRIGASPGRAGPRNGEPTWPVRPSWRPGHDVFVVYCIVLYCIVLYLY